MSEEKAKERVCKLVKIYGMKKILQSLIDVVDSLEAENEERNQGELPYLRLLSIDLSHALKNYERRYDALDQIEPDEVEENDVD